MWKLRQKEPIDLSHPTYTGSGATVEYPRSRLVPRAMGSRAVWAVCAVLVAGTISSIVAPDKKVSELSNEWVVTKHSTILARTNHYVGTVGDTAAQADMIVQGIVHDPNYAKGESTVTVTAMPGEGASDELWDEDSIGRKNPRNEALAKKRLASDVQSLNEALRARGIDATITVENGPREEVLSHGDKSQLEELAKEAGYNNLFEAVENFNELPDGLLKKAINDRFILARGTVFDIEIDTTRVTERPGSDYKIPGINPPLNPEYLCGGGGEISYSLCH